MLFYPDYASPVKNHFCPPSPHGMSGSGDSFGFINPEVKVGYWYVPNGMSMVLDDPRDLALPNAMYRSVE